jgi:hypothetical protein
VICPSGFFRFRHNAVLPAYGAFPTKPAFEEECTLERSCVRGAIRRFGHLPKKRKASSKQWITDWRS